MQVPAFKPGSLRHSVGGHSLKQRKRIGFDTRDPSLPQLSAAGAAQHAAYKKQSVLALSLYDANQAPLEASSWQKTLRL